MNRTRSLYTLVALAIFVLAWPALAEEASVSNRGNMKAKLSVVNDYIRASGNAADSSKVYLASLPQSGVDIAYLTGREWCGSGGCTLLFMLNNAGPYKVVHKETIVNLPISYLVGSRSAPPKVIYWIRGGGVSKPYEVSVSTKTFKVGKVWSDKKVGGGKPAMVTLIDQSSQAEGLSQ